MTNSSLKIAAFSFGAFVLGGAVVGLFERWTDESPPVTGGEELVTGIGGIFFRSENAESSREWYRQYLGIGSEGQGVNFFWREAADPRLLGFTVWSVFPKDTQYFGPGVQEFMVNYRVRDLDELLGRLARQGVERAGEIEEYSYGRFAWIVDGEGRRVELWEPVYSSPVLPE